MDQNFQRRPPERTAPTLRVLPVLDLRSGRAVHARGGVREFYPRVDSVFHSGDDPLGLILAFRDRLGLTEFYLADLDAIEGGRPNLDVIRRSAAAGFVVWVDAGVRDVPDVARLHAAGASVVIAATETLSGPAQLKQISERARPGSVVFGLDLKDGRPLVARGSSWRSDDPAGLVGEAVAAGLRRVLILDTARVGSGTGVGTLAIVRDLLGAGIEVAVGGGVSGKDDLHVLADLGVSAALVGSALHDGRVGVEELREISRAGPEGLADR